MRICLAGGMLHFPPAQRSTVQPTTEVILGNELRRRGHSVVELSPRQVVTGAFLAQGGVDVIHLHHPGRLTTVLSLAPCRVPVVYTPHRTYTPNERALAIGHIRMLQKASAVVTLSPTEAELLRGSGSSTRISVIPNGLSSANFPLATRDRAVGRPFRLLFVGQLIGVKRADLIIQAMAHTEHPEQFELTMVYHRASLKAELERVALAAGVAHQIRWRGRLAGAPLGNEFARADALVLASEHEALPSVITEAMFTGLHVIAPDIGGIRWQLDGWGDCVGTADVQGLGLAFDRALGSQVDQEQSANAAAAARRRFSIEGMVEAHLSLYETVFE